MSVVVLLSGLSHFINNLLSGFQMFIIRFLFDVNVEFPVLCRVAFQHHFDGYFFLFKISVNPQTVSFKLTCRRSKIEVRGIQRKVSAVGQFAININVIVSAFFQAIGV